MSIGMTWPITKSSLTSPRLKTAGIIRIISDTLRERRCASAAPFRQQLTESFHDSPIAHELATIPPLPIRWGVGRGEGSFYPCALRFRTGAWLHLAGTACGHRDHQPPGRYAVACPRSRQRRSEEHTSE